MSRPLRLHVPGGFYHVTLRGNHRQAIFRTPADRELLNGIVAETVSDFGAQVHAYCWMTNHIHALVQISKVPLGKIVLCVASRYARTFQSRMDTTGHLFERRYHALLIDAHRYLFTLIRYIHLNPVRAGLVGEPAAYPWSSHRDYLGHVHTSWVHTSFTLGLLSADARQARSTYMKWMNVRDDSQWGKGDMSPNPGNRQVLGDDQFLARITETVNRRQPRISMRELLTECSRRFGLSAEAISSSSRSHQLSAARAWLYHAALDRGIASVSAIARYLGRSEAAVRRMMLRRPQASFEQVRNVRPGT